MKVVHIVTTTKGGAATAAFRLNDGLTKLGVDSKLLTLFNYSDDKNVFAYLSDFNSSTIDRIGNSVRARLYSRKVAAIRSKIHPDTEAFSLPQSPYKILHNRIIEEADVIHLHWISGFVDYAYFFQKINKPVVFTHHDLNPFRGLFHYQIDERLNKDLRSVDSNILNYKKAVIQKNKQKVWALMLSDWLAEKARESNFYNPDQIIKIRNGVDLAHFKPGNKQVSKEKLGLSLDKMTILFSAGNLDIERKGFKYFVDLSRKMANGNFEFVVMGGSNRAIPEHITYLGNIQDKGKLLQIYQAADLYITTTLEDNQPNTVVEAMACGVPVLAFGSGGVSEMIDPSKNGQIVKENNEESLVTYFKEMTIKRDRLLLMGKEARKKAESDYDLSTSAAEHLKLYKRATR